MFSFFSKTNLTQRTITTLRNYSKNNEIKPVLTNRNPRNLERLRIAYKPEGYHLEKPGNCFWHRLEIETSSKYVTAIVRHFVNGPVIQASTQEWSLKKQLYRFNDAAAFHNLGMVLAQRCLMFGIHEMECYLETTNDGGKIDLFLKALTNNNIVLKEAPQYKKPRPWDQHRPDKPWDEKVSVES